MHRKNQEGMTLAEVLMAVALVAVMIFATMTLTSTSITATKNNMDKQFATQKAIAMLEELKALVQVNTGTQITVLDQYNKSSYLARLTTKGNEETDDPGAPISGNVSDQAGTGWLYSRQIEVKPLLDSLDSSVQISSNDVRMVRVRVFKNERGGRRLLAEVASVVQTLAVTFPPTQVYDVYCIAIENVPGWWVSMTTLVPFVQNAVNDLMDRNPGLEFRQHWITKLAYGRDTQYTPFVNEKNDSLQAINSVYFYPGLMPDTYTPDTGSGTWTTPAHYYYPPGNFDGRIKTENGVINGVVKGTPKDPAKGLITDNPYPYALADMYNHAMRYEDELALYNKRKNATFVDADPTDTATPKTKTITRAQYPNEEMTLRLLLDDMVMRPNLYTNALVINLHGELLPFPPVRNYSDAAKKPDVYAPGVRVVTHPEMLTIGKTDALNLRVYSWVTDPDAATFKKSGTQFGQNKKEWLPEPITVIIRNMKWKMTKADNAVYAISGGVDFNNDTNRDTYTNALAEESDDASPKKRMYFVADVVGNDTRIRLYNTPLISPCLGTNCVSGGLNSTTATPSSRLYGLEYIPSPVEDLTVAAPTPTFSVDLSVGGTDLNRTKPKNTARWVIKIPSSKLNAVTDTTGETIKIETRIGDYDPSSDTFSPAYTEPPNYSATYCWHGGDEWLYGVAANGTYPHLPMTERFQIIGDPRHCPYADSKWPHKKSKNNSPNNDANIGMGYNRFFDGFKTATEDANLTWPGYSYKVTIGGVDVQFGYDPAEIESQWNDGSGTASSGRVEIDMPRIYQIFRAAMMRSNTLYTTMTGYPYYYIGIGNEIGYDADQNWDYNVPVNSKPFDGGNTAKFFEQSITPGRTWGDVDTTDTNANRHCGVKYIMEQDGSWWGMNWIGELYPDNMYDVAASTDDWKGNGNLPSGTGADKFVRVRRDNSNFPPNKTANATHTFGTTFYQSSRRTHQQGIGMFFWNDTNSVVANGGPSTPKATLALAEMGTNYNFTVDSSIDSNRPFKMDKADANTEGLADGTSSAYGGLNTVGVNSTTLELKKFYSSDTSGYISSALIPMREGTTNNITYVVQNGLSPSTVSGTQFIARWSFLSLIQGFFEAGLYNNKADPAVHQVPRLRITAPDVNTNLTNKTSVTISWATDWKRWDGKDYATSYSSYSESETLKYLVLYSTNNGKTWRYLQDDPSTPDNAVPGTRLGTGDSHWISTTTKNLSTPESTFPTGSYLIRVEAYRDNFTLHYAYHQYQFFLNRCTNCT